MALTPPDFLKVKGVGKRQGSVFCTEEIANVKILMYGTAGPVWETLSSLVWLESGDTGGDLGEHGGQSWKVGLCKDKLRNLKFDGEPIRDRHACCPFSIFPSWVSRAET